MDFKTPSLLPPDLLLIQSLLDVLEQSKSLPAMSAPVAVPRPNDEDDIDSSSSENEIANVLMRKYEESSASLCDAAAATDVQKPSEPDESDSDDDISSDSSSEPDLVLKQEDVDNELDEEGGPAAPSQSYFTSQHEIVDSDIIVPEVEQIEEGEALDKVGEISAILDKVVIIKGMPSSNLGANQYALDSDTLLVFEDRKVLGYIFETFGPTAQPFYQVKFNASFPIDTEKVRLSRPVFHVSARSRFIPVRELHRMRGSDASNVFDEEPADHELDFSDDEAEAEHKRNIKQNRRSRREGSVASTSSRFASTAPPLTDAFGTNSVYDDAPYAMNSLPPRPAPIPYDDDPYSDNYGVDSSMNPQDAIPPIISEDNSTESVRRPQYKDRRGRSRGRDGRGRGRTAPSSFSPHASTMPQAPAIQHHPAPVNYPVHYDPSQPNFDTYQFNPSWQFLSQTMVQPHINPRFFGMGYVNQFPPNSSQYWNPNWQGGSGDYNGAEPP